LVGLASEEFKAILESSTSMRQLLENSARQYRTVSEIEAVQKSLPETTMDSCAGDLMTRDVLEISQSESLERVSKTLSQDRHSFYPIAHPESGEYCGALAREHFYNYLQDHSLETTGTLMDIKLDSLPTIRATLSAGKCLELMTRTGSNKLIVIDDSNKLEGILTIRDVLSAGAKEPASTSELEH